MTKIQWTEKTWNPVRGCVKISPGCKHCYASTFAERFRGVAGHPYEQGFDLRLVPDKLRDPLGWKKPAMVFVNSMSDLFQIGVPFEFVDQVFAVMAITPEHTYQVLTKRPERMRQYLEHYPPKTVLVPPVDKRIAAAASEITDSPCAAGLVEDQGWPLPNVWLGVSVENQKYADERIPLLLETPAAVRFLSVEPLLESVDISPFIGYREHVDFKQGADWVIVGGESGPGARPFNLNWAEGLREQCRAADVAFFMKQIGSRPVWDGKKRSDGTPFYPVLKYAAKDRKGGDPLEWPEHLRVREFPKARPA